MNFPFFFLIVQIGVKNIWCETRQKKIYVYSKNFKRVTYKSDCSMKSQCCRKDKASVPISKATTPISHNMKLATRNFEEAINLLVIKWINGRKQTGM